MVFAFRKSRHSHQLLQPGIASDWNDQPPAYFELFLERLGNFGPPCGDDDAVVGRMFWPALGAIAVQNVHILIAEVGQCRGCLLGELTDPFYGVDLAGNFRENSCRVARSSSDLKDPLTALQRQRLRHEGDDVGLGNCLIRFDRQRGVLVSKLAQLLRQECFAWDLAHGTEDQFGAHAPRKNCPVNHFMAKAAKVSGKMVSHRLIACHQSSEA